MKIAVLSRGANLYSTKRLIEACNDRDIEVSLLDHLRCNIIIEQDHPQIYYHRKRVEGIDAIIPRVGASVTFYGAAVITQFQMMGVFTPVTSQALLRSRNKLRSLQILSKNGIGLPNTVFTDYMQDADQLTQVLGEPPWIIKLLEGTQGLGVVLAENKSAAQSVIEAFNKLKARIIVQEFIAESSGKDLRVFVVGGKVVGAMKRQGKKGEFCSNRWAINAFLRPNKKKPSFSKSSPYHGRRGAN